LDADWILRKSAIPLLLQPFSGRSGSGPSWTPIYIGRPVRDFFDLRRRVRTEMLKFEHVSLPTDWSEDAILSQRPPVTARKNENSLRDLSAELISFGQSEWLAAKILGRYGFDPVLAGQQLFMLASEAGSAAGGRSASYRAVLEALRFPVHWWRERGL
jgi:hypothetical protein